MNPARTKINGICFMIESAWIDFSEIGGSALIRNAVDSTLEHVEEHFES